MAQTTTTADLAGMFARFTRAAERLAPAPAGKVYHLETGSKTYGRAFRLYLRAEKGGALHSTPFLGSNGYLGMTRREAYEALHLLAAALEGVSYLQDRTREAASAEAARFTDMGSNGARRAAYCQGAADVLDPDRSTAELDAIRTAAGLR